MKITELLLTALLCTAPLLPAQAASVTIPGADPSLPDKAYLENIVDRDMIDLATEESRSVLSFLKTAAIPVHSADDILADSVETFKASNFHSSLFILSDKDRHIAFTIPKNSVRGLVMPKAKGYAQFVDTHNGNIGIEISPVRNQSTWETTGKPYRDITKEDMKRAFTKHNPKPDDVFIDGGKFSYQGLSNGTWDVATMNTSEGTETISTVNFSLEGQPKYMYHIGIINNTPNPDYRKDLGLLANYTLPSVTTNISSAIPSVKTDLGAFTVAVMSDLKETTNTYNEKTGGFKKFNGPSTSHLILSQPIPEGFKADEIIYYALKDALSMPMFNPQNDNRYYAVWHNGRPGFIMDFRDLNGKPSILSYVTTDNTSILISRLIYNREEISASQDDLLKLISSVSTKDNKNSDFGITHVLKEMTL